MSVPPVVDFQGYLDDVRTLVLDDIRARLPAGQANTRLYRLVLDYPLRSAKALRPALCLATCRAIGGSLAVALPSATALELYHNAFLIHDDIEDGSETRRGSPTLHRAHGVPMAVNVGDAMLALALGPLLENTATMGLGPALQVLQTVADMARISAEGQSTELEWVRDGQWNVNDADYLEMIEKKTAWYTFVAPVRLGGIAARLDEQRLSELDEFARVLGLAFQIRDDWLNVQGDPGAVGKEAAGDLWEGKRTLMLLHALRTLPAHEAEKARGILARPRPGMDVPEGLADLVGEVEQLALEGALTSEARLRLLAKVHGRTATKTQAEIDWLLARLREVGSLDYAHAIAARYASEAEARLAAMTWLQPSVHRGFLEQLVAFVVGRPT